MIYEVDEILDEAKEILKQNFDNDILAFFRAVNIKLEDSIAISYVHGSKLPSILNDCSEDMINTFKKRVFTISVNNKIGNESITLTGQPDIEIKVFLDEDHIESYSKILLLILKETETNILIVKNIPLRREVIECIVNNKLGEIVYDVQ